MNKQRKILSLTFVMITLSYSCLASIMPARAETDTKTKVIGCGALLSQQIGEFDSRKNIFVPDSAQPTWSSGKTESIDLIGSAFQWDCLHSTGSRYLQAVTKVSDATYFAVHNGDLYEVHAPSSTATLIRRERHLADLGASTVAVDTRRNLLAVTFDRSLIYRDLNTSKWLPSPGAKIVEHGEIPVSMVYRPSEDCFYLLSAFYPKVPCGWPKAAWLSLSKIESDGKVVTLGRLQGNFDLPDNGRPLQLLDLDGQLVVMAETSGYSIEKPSSSRLYRLDDKKNLTVVGTTEVDNDPGRWIEKRNFFDEYLHLSIVPELKKHSAMLRNISARGTVHLRLAKSGAIVECTSPAEQGNSPSELKQLVDQVVEFPKLPESAPPELDLELTLESDGYHAMLKVILARD
ncbi:MAG: hypothetical protein K2X93_19330 [Candidatus Obscuribacterales bacterium]|nr:hypothetical protein [Candidatus Obscuribacterales bacterium]